MNCLDTERLISLLQEKLAILVDIREKDEWDHDHISIAKHYPLSKLLQGPAPLEFEKAQVVFLHCKSGGRTLIAQKHLSSTLNNIEPLLVKFEELKEILKKV